MEGKKWYCYILRSTNENFKNCTYNGSTNDPWRRLRQHNEEIVGGAKATKGKGPWEIYFLMTGFKTHNNALSCEWKIKHPTSKKIRPNKYSGQIGRIKALNEILHLNKWTANCEENVDCSYTLYIVSEFAEHINKLIVPKYIKIIEVDEINSKTIKN